MKSYAKKLTVIILLLLVAVKSRASNQDPSTMGAEDLSCAPQDLEADKLAGSFAFKLGGSSPIVPAKQSSTEPDSKTTTAILFINGIQTRVPVKISVSLMGNLAFSFPAIPVSESGLTTCVLASPDERILRYAAGTQSIEYWVDRVDPERNQNGQVYKVNMALKASERGAPPAAMICLKDPGHLKTGLSLGDILQALGKAIKLDPRCWI